MADSVRYVEAMVGTWLITKYFVVWDDLLNYPVLLVSE